MTGGPSPAGGAANGAGGRNGGRARNANGFRARNGGADGASGRDAPVRFRFLELAYGCHRRRVEFAGRERPFVILGPNGAGKSTLVEAAVRVLYGFNRQRKDDRELHDARRPWGGSEYRATLGLEGPFGRASVERDFDTDEVLVRSEASASAGGAESVEGAGPSEAGPSEAGSGEAATRPGDAGGPLYEGEANPAASGREADAYRELLERLLGLAELEAYQRTACVRQGELIATRLSEDLLQLAAGGHADVEEARQQIRSEHYALTKRPAGEGEARRRKPGEIERLRERAAALEERLEEARAAEERRRPLAEERDEVERRLSELEGEMERLREAFRGLSELETLDARREASLARIRRLEETRRELDEAIARVELLEERAAPTAGAYPPDFLERVAALEEGLWPRLARLEGEIAGRREELEGVSAGSTGLERGLAVAATLLLVAGVTVLATGASTAGGAGLLGGALLGGSAAWLRVERTRRRAACADALATAREELAEVEGRIRVRLEGVPDADTLSPASLPDRRREFEWQRRDARTREKARSDLGGALDRARSGLAEVEDAVRARGDEPGSRGAVPSDEAGGAGMAGRAGLLRRGRELLRRLETAEREERNERLAPLQLELRQVSRTQFSLPDGVRADADAVEAALERRAEEERTLRGRLSRLLRRLAYEARPEESPVALAARLRDVRVRLERLEARAAACRHAFRLVGDAYEEFRRTDQRRLLEGVSGHLERATGGELGPVRAREGQLEEAAVEAAGRSLPLTSPPLSYGQLHSVLFAVRLGASDFLAGFGVRLPLIVDDPFVHLDERRAGELWEVFSRIAAERQVLVATQDRLLLEHLEIEPDLRLEAVRP